MNHGPFNYSSTRKLFREAISKSHICDRTVLYATAASGAPFHVNTAGSFFDSDLEISWSALYGLNISIGNKLDVYMPADLDQFR